MLRWRYKEYCTKRVSKYGFADIIKCPDFPPEDADEYTLKPGGQLLE